MEIQAFALWPWWPCLSQRWAGFQWWARSACKQCCACCRERWRWVLGWNMTQKETRLVISQRAAVSAAQRWSMWQTTEQLCYSLLVGDGLVAAVTHAHLELEAHEGDGGAFGRALATHSLATLPTVVLENTERTQHPQTIILYSQIFKVVWEKNDYTLVFPNKYVS